MSHFTVMVIGPDVKEQLAPFHEFECTGLNDQYVQEIDITDEFRGQIEAERATGESDPLQAALGWYGYEDRIIENLADIDINGKHKYAYVVVKDGNLEKVVKRTNPNAKWDWWVLGGRWTGFLKLKPNERGSVGQPGLMTDLAPEGYADSARKGDVDWEGMRADAEQGAREDWDKVKEIAPDFWESWESVRGRFSKVEEARTFYNGQEALVSLRKANLGYWDYDQFLIDRESYIRNARNKAIMTFAFLKDGQWVEKGEMGWFACVSNEKDPEAWNEEFNKMFDALPDDTLISIVDCHI